MIKRVLLVLAVPLALAAQDKTKTPAELKVGTGVEKKEIVGAATEFKVAPDTKLYAWAKVSGIAAGGGVSIAFDRGEKKVFEKALPVGGSPWRVNAYRTFRAGDGGDWTARLVGADGVELGSVKFKVEIQK